MKKNSSSVVGSRVMYIAIVSLLICSLVFSTLMGANDSPLFYYGVMPVMACFFFGKFVTGMMFCKGWKVFNRKMFMGLPVSIFVFYAIIFALLITMTMINQGMGDFPNSQKNINVFLFNAWAGVFASLIAWFTGIKNWMAGGSEYDARIEFKHKGYSQEVIEAKILALRKAGLID